MNVLFIDQFGELGGAQQCLLDLMPAVLDQGWIAFAAVPSRGELASRLRLLGVDATELEPGDYTSGRKTFPDMVRYVARLPLLAKQLQDLCTRHRIDLVYANGPRILAVTPRNIPLVFHAHSFLPRGPSRNLARWASRRSNSTVIAVSKFVAGYLPAERLCVIPNGVPDLRSKRRGGRIGIIGRIAPEKGQLEFVEAARLLPEYRFMICGAPVLATPSYARHVMERAKGLEIHFTGWREDISSVLADLDLLVVPSADGEALGRVVLEAFSAEVPVVAFPSGGIPELIEDGRTGFLVEPQTPQALADRIRNVLRDPQRLAAVTRNARALWESNYTLALYRERVTKVIDRAANNAIAPAASKTGG